MEGGCCVSGSPYMACAVELSGLPVVDVEVAGIRSCGLIDKGCSQTMVRAGLVGGWQGKSSVEAFDGRFVHCVGIACFDIVIHEYVLVRARVIGVETLIDGVDIIVGIWIYYLR